MLSAKGYTVDKYETYQQPLHLQNANLQNAKMHKSLVCFSFNRFSVLTFQSEEN